MKKTELNITEERNYFKPFNYPWAYDAWLKHEQSPSLRPSTLCRIQRQSSP